ncbi:uncharacterized protein TEOVI_000069200 [Trypanosoma equiperdum]|uniref:Uncharacterized protein n=3 Tax=Trypanozoon TaxID=39700 RepID=Q585K7_TRYB2|nr:hypothetical protein, conserved [Trypanosoma brucei brucei TREU927]AAX79230.1 hypothetical protein, conserved [Trypanosoma brucei]AAZ10934.1 hypothetical protein, conserved [Trypanosoma brucei brucei TREU927]RHW72871.1 hypothetical protein DPX39_040037800 [Trypanosoma brucei equiperdum]SCU69135.1 hypothetical protein, conserved [Trypanosoma equiperdum]
MGQDQSMAFANDTISGEQYRAHQVSRQDIIRRAFQKCVVPLNGGAGDKNGLGLDSGERACVEEFALLYSAYGKNGFAQFSQLYEQYQRDMFEKARVEMMTQQARKELSR